MICLRSKMVHSEMESTFPGLEAARSWLGEAEFMCVQMLMHMHIHPFAHAFPGLVYVMSASREFKSDNQTVIIVSELA